MLHYSDIDWTDPLHPSISAFGMDPGKNTWKQEMWFIEHGDDMAAWRWKVYRVRLLATDGYAETVWSGLGMEIDVMVCDTRYCSYCNPGSSPPPGERSQPLVHGGDTWGNEFVPDKMVVREPHEQYDDEAMDGGEAAVFPFECWDVYARNVRMCDLENCKRCSKET